MILIPVCRHKQVVSGLSNRLMEVWCWSVCMCVTVFELWVTDAALRNKQHRASSLPLIIPLMGRLAKTQPLMSGKIRSTVCASGKQKFVSVSAG